MAGLTAAQQRRGAIRRALEAGLQRRVQRVHYGVYLVPSTSRAAVHTVTHFANPDELCCTCEGGAHLACVHRAAVYLAKLEARGLRPVLAAVVPITARPQPAVPVRRPARAA
jgi:hypothetical protein